MRNWIAALALLWTGMLCAGVPWGFAGQPGVYSTLYNGGSEYRQAENGLKGIVAPYTPFTSASTSQQVAIATMPGLWSPRAVQVEETSSRSDNAGGQAAQLMTVRVCGVTLQ